MGGPQPFKSILLPAHPLPTRLAQVKGNTRQVQSLVMFLQGGFANIGAFLYLLCRQN